MVEMIQSGERRGWRVPGDAGVPDDREDRLLPWRSVREIAGISRTTAWRLQQTGDFPRPVPISANRVGWWESDLTAWKALRRSAGGERPRPYGRANPISEAPRIRSVGQRVAAPPPPVGPAPTEPALLGLAGAPRRRARPRAVSPDQIDFGF